MKTLKKPKQVTVKLKTWLRGRANSSLRTKSRTMCCLGFWARAAGVPAKALTGCRTPVALVPSFLLKGLVTGEQARTMVCDRMMRCNDDPDITDETRMRTLKELADELGVEMLFV